MKKHWTLTSFNLPEQIVVEKLKLNRSQTVRRPTAVLKRQVSGARRTLSPESNGRSFPFVTLFEAGLSKQGEPTEYSKLYVG